VDFAPPTGGDNAVHKVQELDATAAAVVVRRDLAIGHIEGGKQRAGTMALIIVRLATESTTVRQSGVIEGVLMVLADVDVLEHAQRIVG
jgi:hypothetical protein